MAQEQEKTQTKKREDASGGRRRRIPLNIGTLLFGAVFLYILVSMILYLTSTHVRSYQVTAGPLAKNALYTGLAVRSETIVRADAPGYLSYFAQENSKIKKNGAVYAVSTNPQDTKDVELTGEGAENFKADIRNFSGNYTANNFNEVYTLKYHLSSALYENLLVEAPELDPEKLDAGTITIGEMTISCAPTEGIVSYAVDGYEDFDMSSFGEEELNPKNYNKTDLKQKRSVQAGEDVYKIIDKNNWSLVIPLTSKQVVQLSGRKAIRVKFLQDGLTQRADFSILEMGEEQYFGRLDFTSGLERYVNERFLEVELVTNNDVGLKIPVSSIVTKNFLTVPERYATLGGDGTEIGFLVSRVAEDGSKNAVFTTTTLYEHKDGLYYIDSDELEAGDVLLLENEPAETYTLRDTAPLEGVYSLNKGYAVFRKVVIIDKNEEYCIVESGTSYGIAQFDYIVLDAASVEESEITA